MGSINDHRWLQMKTVRGGPSPSIKLTWARAEDKLVMPWSRAVVLGVRATTVWIHLNLIQGTWPRINQSQGSFCWVKVELYNKKYVFYSEHHRLYCNSKQQLFFHIFIYTAKVVANTVHNSTYIHLLTIRHVTEFTFIACMQNA